MRALIVCLVLVALAAQDRKTASYQGTVAALRVAADTLGQDWRLGDELVVDDFDDLQAQPPHLRDLVAKAGRQLQPLGVRAMAKFTYKGQDDLVVLGLYVFDDDEACRTWWNTRHQGAGWEKDFTLITDVPYPAVDDRFAVRYVAFGNVAIDARSTRKSVAHLKAIDAVVGKLQQ